MTYLITYQAYKGNTLVKSGVIRAKNKYTELEAKVTTEQYLKKKYDFDRFVVTSCISDNPFRDIFGFNFK